MRHQDWPERLAALIEARRGTPFAWGGQDCMSFAADVVLELTGVDFLAPHRGTYGSEDEAEAILAEAGGLEALLAGLAADAGLAERNPRLTRRGDLVLVRVGNQLMAGVVLGTEVAVPGAERLGFVPARLATRAWTV